MVEQPEEKKDFETIIAERTVLERKDHFLSKLDQIEVKINQVSTSYNQLFDNLLSLKFMDDENWRTNHELTDSDFFKEDKAKKQEISDILQQLKELKDLFNEDKIQNEKEAELRIEMLKDEFLVLFLGKQESEPLREEKISQLIEQYEQQIPALKEEALKLKKEGKQREALNALRKAKMLEAKVQELKE